MGNLLIIMLYSSDVLEYTPRTVPFPPLKTEKHFHNQKVR